MILGALTILDEQRESPTLTIKHMLNITNSIAKMGRPNNGGMSHIPSIMSNHELHVKIV